MTKQKFYLCTMGLFIALFFSSSSRAMDYSDVSTSDDFSVSDSSIGTCRWYYNAHHSSYATGINYSTCIERYNSGGYYSSDYFTIELDSSGKYIITAHDNGQTSRYAYTFLVTGSSITLNDDDQYVIDNDSISAYEAKITSLKNTSLITDGDLSLLESEILAQQTKQDSTLSALSQANSDLTSSSNLLSNAQDLATANPDSTTINSNLNTISSLFNDSVDDYQAAYDDAKNVVDSTASNVALISQSKDLNNDNSDLLVLVDDSVDGIKTCDDYECWNSKKIDIDDNLGKIETNNATIEENKNTITNNTNTINNKTESSISNSSKVTNNYTSINNITNNSSSSASNGETCVGDECIENPDSTDVSQTPINDIPTGESFYTSAYEDGFQGVFDKKITALKATEFYGAAQNFVFTGTGSVPNWSISVGNYGSFDLSLSSDIWDFIKICFLITTGFLCRRLVFGG